MADIYTWHVIFEDDSTLNEFDNSETGRGFADVEKAGKRVKMLELWPQRTGTVHRVLIPVGAAPVCFRRRTIELDPNSGEQQRSTVHCIGWKRNEQGTYLFVFSYGLTLLTDDFEAV